MNRVLAAGGLLLVVGIGGYLLGIAVPYRGRAFAVMAVMLGITFIAIGTSRGYREAIE